MTNKLTDRQALEQVFGVRRRDGMITGVPIAVPALMRKIVGQKITLKKGVPVEFADIMTPEQKAEYARLTGRAKPKTETGEE